MHFSTLFSHCPCCGSNQFENNNIKSKRCLACGFVYYINPSAAVAAFILNDKSELLVCIRANEPGKGSYDLPGGFVDFNESAEMALTREIKEELNVDIKELSYKFSIPNDYEYSGMNIPTLDLFFSCSIVDEKQMKASDDVEAYLFIGKENLKPELFGLDSIHKAISIFKNQSL